MAFIMFLWAYSVRLSKIQRQGSAQARSLTLLKEKHPLPIEPVWALTCHPFVLF